MLLVIRVHLGLIIPRESVNEGHAFVTAYVVNHDVNDRKWILVFGTSFVEILKVNADMHLPIFL